LEAFLQQSAAEKAQLHEIVRSRSACQPSLEAFEQVPAVWWDLFLQLDCPRVLGEALLRPRWKVQPFFQENDAWRQQHIECPLPLPAFVDATKLIQTLAAWMNPEFWRPLWMQLYPICQLETQEDLDQLWSWLRDPNWVDSSQVQKEFLQILRRKESPKPPSLCMTKLVPPLLEDWLAIPAEILQKVALDIQVGRDYCFIMPDALELLVAHLPPGLRMCCGLPAGQRWDRAPKLNEIQGPLDGVWASFTVWPQRKGGQALWPSQAFAYAKLLHLPERLPEFTEQETFLEALKQIVGAMTWVLEPRPLQLFLSLHSKAERKIRAEKIQSHFLLEAHRLFPAKLSAELPPAPKPCLSVEKELSAVEKAILEENARARYLRSQRRESLKSQGRVGRAKTKRSS
jgi:hypothetical protein